LQAGTEASLGESGYRYERHRPEWTLLYQLVAQYYAAFVAQLATQDVFYEYLNDRFPVLTGRSQEFGQ
jgi:hypothetical protein